MATGALDANGIWQYGEDDSNTTFSALLNRLGSSTSTQQGSNKTRLTALEAKPLAGLVPIVPPTVNYSGGTATANALGKISFTGVSSISLNNAFTSIYTNYRIVINAKMVSGSAEFYYRMRASGTDTTSNVYNHWRVSGYTNSSGPVSGTGGDWSVGRGYLGYISPNQSASNLEVYKPQLAEITSTISDSVALDAAALFGQRCQGFCWNTTQYDGITIYPASGSMTGSLTVYGYNA